MFGVVCLIGMPSQTVREKQGLRGNLKIMINDERRKRKNP